MAVEFQTQKYSDEEIHNQMNPLLSAWFKYKFKQFTEPQRYAIMNIHRRENTLISAVTGSGKTLSAFTAVLNELITASEQNALEDRVYCIYISPLKALANDIDRNLKEPLEEIQKAGKKTGKKIDFRIAVRTGDTKTSERAAQLRKPPHILITTPETLAILLNAPKFLDNLKKANWVIIDEIHSLAESKRGVHLSLTLERLQRLNPGICRVGLSATIAPIEDVAKFLVGMKNEKEPRDCKIVDCKMEKGIDLKVISPVSDMINTTQEEIHKALYGKLHELIQAHKTTLVFTNTRSATERVVDYLKEAYAGHYIGNIGAHHSSVSREKRLNIEERLKKGELRVVVSSTSLELGIDIGYIDLVVLLGSPKSIARCLQRVGRSGHKLHDTIKGRIIVLDRDDLVECCVLAKNAKERRIDRIKIPENALDVLAQQIYGMAIYEKISEKDLLEIIKGSYCYRNLLKNDFYEILSYLSGEFSSLEIRHVYGKIWWDRETKMIGRRGKNARIIYMTNIGTIPDEARIEVKIADHLIGYIDEAFMEHLTKGDVFVLGGEKYVYRYARGMTIQVQHEEKRPPTIPSWVSEMLPLSFDLANEIQHFRCLMEEKFRIATSRIEKKEIGKKEARKEIIGFIHAYLYCDENAADAIYNYFNEQFKFSKIPHEKKLIIEQINESDETYVVFHTLYGRRVNDVLSRAFGWLLGKLMHKDVAISMNDNGFVISSGKKIPLQNALNLLLKEDIGEIARSSLRDSEILKRRFRHCATRALMILRNYKGRTKTVGRQYMASHLLYHAVLGISENFPMLEEARREILNELMDLETAKKVVEKLKDGTIKYEILQQEIPSSFAFNIYTMGRSDTVRIESKLDFIKRLHQKMMERIGEKQL